MLPGACRKPSTDPVMEDQFHLSRGCPAPEVRLAGQLRALGNPRFRCRIDTITKPHEAPLVSGYNWRYLCQCYDKDFPSITLGLSGDGLHNGGLNEQAFEKLCATDINADLANPSLQFSDIAYSPRWNFDGLTNPSTGNQSQKLTK